MEDLRKLQLVELEIMDEFVRVCQELNIQYFITCGTALGAVRHGGFIPWDDDMDIGLLREDYEKFIELAPGVLDDKYWLEARTTDEGFNQLIIKLRKKNTIFKSKFEKDKICNGIFIDIYAFDLLPNNKIKRKFVIKYAQILRWLHILRNTTKRPVQKGRSLKWRIQEGMLRITHPIMKIFSHDFFRVKMEKYITKFNKSENKWITCHFDSQPISMKLEDFYPLKNYNFEDRNYLIMKNEDEYLKQMYGNYMEMPPENKRITHMPEIIKF